MLAVPSQVRLDQSNVADNVVYFYLILANWNEMNKIIIEFDHLKSGIKGLNFAKIELGRTAAQRKNLKRRRLFNDHS